MEVGRPKLGPQRHVGDGAVAEHAATRMAQACRATPELVSWPANMRHLCSAVAACPKAFSAAVPAMPTAISSEAGVVSTRSMPAAAMRAAVSPASVAATEVTTGSMPAITMAAAVPAATVTAAAMSAPAAAAGVCLKCEKRHDEKQHGEQVSAGPKRRPHSIARLGGPLHLGRPIRGVPPRTKSF